MVTHSGIVLDQSELRISCDSLTNKQVLIVLGVSSSHYKHSAVADRTDYGRLFVCVRVPSPVCLLMCQPFVVYSLLPLSQRSFSASCLPTMHCWLYQAEQKSRAVLGYETPPGLQYPYLLSFSPFLYLLFTSLLSFNLQPWHFFTARVVFCCFSVASVVLVKFPILMRAGL